MTRLKSTFLLIFIFLLSGCTGSINLQAFPKPKVEKEITDIKITYILPDSVCNYEEADNTLLLCGFHYGPESKQERLFFINQDDKIWKIERRTDNGVSGSGRIFHIEVSKQKVNLGTAVTYSAKRESQYQEGLILPFSIPEFDIKSYLANASVNYSFELNSSYSVDSVKANFDRLLKKNDISKYYLKIQGAASDNVIKFYPYKNGTKISVQSMLYNMQPIDDVIDVSGLITLLKSKIKAVLDS
jgi:hypothetical protein